MRGGGGGARTHNVGSTCEIGYCIKEGGGLTMNKGAVDAIILSERVGLRVGFVYAA